MVQLMQAYRSWILAQHIEDCTLSEGSDDNVVISGDLVKGWVNFYDIDGACIVELRLERVLDGEPAFFLHFELEDIVRAQKLFGKMAEAIHDATHREIRHVLLCCSCGMTTTFFAMRQRPCATPQPATSAGSSCRCSRPQTASTSSSATSRHASETGAQVSLRPIMKTHWHASHH